MVSLLHKLIEKYPEGANCDRTGVGFVPGVGSTPAEIMIIGEAPGAEESRQGKPFVGPAGALLSECLKGAGINRDNVYITNVVKFRPTLETSRGVENRPPTHKEITDYVPFLIKEMQDVQPKLIILLGAVALKVFSGKSGITRARGLITTDQVLGCKLLPTYHPSYILHSIGDSKVRFKEQLIKDLSTAKTYVETGSLEVKRTPTHYTLVDSTEGFEALMCRLFNAPIVDFDLETTGLNYDTHEIMCVALSPAEAESYVVPLLVGGKLYWGDKHQTVIDRLKGFFESDIPKSAHMGSFDVQFLRKVGIRVKNFACDTLIMHYLLNENAKSHGLKELALEYTDLGLYDAEIEEWKNKLIVTNEPCTACGGTGEISGSGAICGSCRGKGEVKPAYSKKTVDFSKIPFSVIWPYAAADVDATGRLRRIFHKQLEKEGLIPLFKRIVMPAQNTLCEMEWNGVKIDVDKLRNIRSEYEKAAADIDIQLRSHPCNAEAKELLEVEEVNWGSPVQLRRILFDILKLKPVKTTKTGKSSTDEATLKELARMHDIPKLIMQKRSYEHLVSAYGSNFESFIKSDGRIHTKLLMHGTEVGRLSSRNPNLQNIPRMESDMDTGEATIASRARDIFISPEGSSLIELDFSQIQYRIWAFYVGDLRMKEALETGQDIHRLNASVIFNKSSESVTKEERQAAKAFTYAVIMGASHWKIAQHFKIDEDRAMRLLDRWYSIHPLAREYNNRMILSARSHGFVTNLFGRRRRLQDIVAPDRKIRGHAERSAINAPIQGLEADILFITMNRIRKAFTNSVPAARLLLTVHDSIVAECLTELSHKVAQIMYREATKPIPGFNIPIEAEVKVGQSFGSMKPLSKDQILEHSQSL